MAIRSLRAPAEVDAYVVLHRVIFESESMRRGWRERTTPMPGYRNALDLVLVSEAGELCGFCVAWLRERATGTTVGQIEPLGSGSSRSTGLSPRCSASLTASDT